MARAPEKTFVSRAEAEAEQLERAALEERHRRAIANGEIGIHLWCTVPGLEDVPSNDERRWRFFWGPPLDLIIRRLLTRLKRLPQVVEIRAHGNATDVMGVHDQAWTVDDAGQVITGDIMVPLATFFQGVTTAAIEEVHQDLIAAGWRPSSLQPQTGKAA